MQILNNGHACLVQARHGLMLVNRNDQYIGQSIIRYGEFSDGEVDVFREIVRAGDTVVEVGSNIGAHTLPLAKLVGPQGRMLAFEPQYFVHQLLSANLALNALSQVRALLAACGEAPGHIMVPVLDPARMQNFGGLGLGQHEQGDRVPVMTLDSLQLDRCRLLKADVEGMELQVLRGARETIARCRPVLYVENDRVESSAALIAHLFELGYDCHWHLPLMFSPQNFFGSSENIFANIVSCNMLCVPRGQAVPAGLPLHRVDGVNSRWQDAMAAVARSRPAPAPAAAAAIEQARQALDRGDGQAAQQILGAAGSARERDLEALAALVGAASARACYPLMVTALERMLVLRPDDAGLLSHLGAAHGLSQRHDLAADLFARAIQHQPDQALDYFNLGNALRELGRIADSIRCCRRGLELDPASSMGHLLLANALSDDGQLAPAAEHFGKALQTDPQNARAHKNLGILLLRQGDYEHGWQEYEWRFAADGLVPPAARFAQPVWDGSPLAGRRLLLTGEQGLGDQIQFARHAAGIEGQVVLRVHDRLVGLLRRDFPAVIGMGDRLPEFDVHATLMSLPGILKTRPEDFAQRTPYLSVEPARADRWRARMAHLQGLRVGLAWQGNREQLRDNLRSLPLALLQPLMAVESVQWVSLQKGDGQEQIASCGFGPRINDFSAEMDNEGVAFLDTAAVMHNLDLVISVDSAIAHVAGALGRPVWLLSRAVGDWRWGVQGEHTPWYPSMRVLRQPVAQDWGSLMPQLVDRLRARVAAR